jgi:hypothetical protein
LREIQANFGPEFGVLFKCHLSCWNRMSDQNQRLWLKSTSSPRSRALHGYYKGNINRKFDNSKEL